MDTRNLILDIIKAGTKAYFDDIAAARDAETRERAICTLRDLLVRVKDSLKMSEPVFGVYFDDSIKSLEFLDPDRWLVNRLQNMGDLPLSLQQELVEYGLKRLIS